VIAKLYIVSPGFANRIFLTTAKQLSPENFSKIHLVVDRREVFGLVQTSRDVPSYYDEERGTPIDVTLESVGPYRERYFDQEKPYSLRELMNSSKETDTSTKVLDMKIYSSDTYTSIEA